MSILNELLDWCESNCRKISNYYEDIVESLSYYNTPISSQSNCFERGLKYYFNNEDKIVYIYCGKGKNLFTDNAAAITINCNKNSATYSYYKILDEELIPDLDTEEDKYWKCIENWRKDNYVFEKLSIVSAIEKFNNYAGTNIKITLEDNTKIISDFVYKINESKKLKVIYDCESLNDFLSSKIADLMIVAVDTNVPIIRIAKEYDTFVFIVDITNDDGDKFIISTKLSDKSQLNKLLYDTIEALKLYEQFAKYADDLENCI